MNEHIIKSALAYHIEGRPGKIAIQSTKPTDTPADLSLAYSPGVAAPCLEISRCHTKAYDYTAKGNLVAVITNGTAVLGLGNIGAVAAKPVMEGKAILLKKFADIDVFDIEIDEADPDRFIHIVKALEPTFGGINLEDIKAPECFKIETSLKDMMDIPVMHDDQHGTAIVSAAALLNALEIQGKEIAKVRFVVSGAGAAALSCVNLYMRLGARIENILFFDSRGAVSEERTDLNAMKLPFAVGKKSMSLQEALRGADVFAGLSRGNLLTAKMVQSMAKNPIVFAMANPDPEISYPVAMHARPDIIMATGRSDFPNQVNNVLGFPYIFRGALDVGAKKINEEMLIAAAYALAQIAKEPTPDAVRAFAPDHALDFGRHYILPIPFDTRLLHRIAPAVARAAIDSGVARKTINDWDAYEKSLAERVRPSSPA